MRGRWLQVVWAVLLVAGAGVARAQPGQDANREAARQLGREGLSAYEAGDYAVALDKFERAHQLVGLTSTGLYIARSLERLGRLVEASDMYLEVVRMPLGDDARQQHIDAQKEARSERAALLPRIPQLTVVVTGAEQGSGLVVRIDGAELPTALVGAKRPTDPGPHTIEAQQGSRSARRSVELSEGEHREVVLALSPSAGAEPAGGEEPSGSPEPAGPDEPFSSVQPALGWTAVGLGGALLVTGAVTGGLVLSLRGELKDACPEVAGERQCQPSEHDKVDRYHALRIVSGVGLIGGGVLAATGLTLLLAAPDDGQSAAIAPLVWPGGAGLRIRY